MFLEVEIDGDLVHLSVEHLAPANDDVVTHRATMTFPRAKLPQIAFAIRTLSEAAKQGEEEESIDIGEGELFVSQARGRA